MKKKICILDYGSGNIYSLACALKRLEVDFVITNETVNIIDSTHLIIPGVGSFDSCMSKIYSKDLIKSIYHFKKTNKPILGICVGMQILSTFGFENKKSKGLDLINGEVDIISRGPSLNLRQDVKSISSFDFIDKVKKVSEIHSIKFEN